MKAGLFGGGWEDYLDTLNDTFDRHAMDNWPLSPFGASVDAIATGYGNDGGASPAASPGADSRNPIEAGGALATTGSHVGNLIGDVAGKIWDLPNTALGLGAGAIAGLATLATGQVPHIGLSDGAIQISNLKDLSDIGLGGALTLGDVQLYNGVKPDTEIGPSQSPYIQPDGSSLYGFTIGKHEGGHTMVDDRLGPFALPLYLFSAVKNGWSTNPYEQKADQQAAFGSSPFP